MFGKTLATRRRARITRLVSLWLTIARAEDADHTVRARLAAALDVAATVDERLAQVGVAGVAGALDTHRRLAAVLNGLDAGRLSALRDAVTSLERELEAAARVLARLRAMKERVALLR
jgi:hypothetical protein